MHIDSVLILSLIVSCVAFFGLVALFTFVFQRKLGLRRRDKSQEVGEISETERLAPVMGDSQVEYTTTNVQPESRVPIDGYPHNQGDMKDVEDDSEEELAGEPEVNASLTILLRYDRQRSYLLLKLLNMFDLPSRRDKTEVNSFLEIRLLPHFGHNPIQTDVYHNNKNPKLEETFEFEVDHDELALQKIEFVVMDAREYSNRCIGYAICKIDGLNINELMAEKEVNTVLTIGKPKMQRSLSESSLSSPHESGDEMIRSSSLAEGLDTSEDDQPRKTKATVRLAKDWEYVAGMEPMILLSLHYARESEKLVLAIIKVANLNVLPNNKMPDPYVKVHIYIGKRLKLKKKTAVMKQELNPVYNQKLEFPLRARDLGNVKLVLSVKNHLPTRGRQAAMHEVVIGESSTGTFLEHWKSALASNKAVAKWHVMNQK